MKSILLLKMALGLSLALFVSGCAGFVSSPVVPPLGTFFNSTTFPVDIEFEPTDIGSKSGSTKSCSVLGLVAWGDSSVETAAKNGGIKQIDHVDARFFNVLGIYSEYEVTAFGKTAEEIRTPTTQAPVAAPDTTTGG